MAERAKVRREGPRRQRFTDNEGLREAIREVALDTLGGARRVWKELPEEERPSYVIVQSILNELGLGTKAEREAARAEAGIRARPIEGEIEPWEHTYLETREEECAGKSFYLCFALDRMTARARVGALSAFTSAAETTFIEHIVTKESDSIRKLMIGRGGMRRRKVGEELRAWLEEHGVAYRIEGRWGSMGMHRSRLVGIIETELREVKDMKELRSALATAMKVYNEETVSAEYPCFGLTPDRTYLDVLRGRRLVPWTTRKAKRSGIT